MAKESAENIQQLKACWDAGNLACVADMRNNIELSDRAYNQLKVQDGIVGHAYQDSADWYADIIDNCAGKCGWLEANLLKGTVNSLNTAIYAALGSAPIKNPPENVLNTGELVAKNTSGSTVRTTETTMLTTAESSPVQIEKYRKQITELRAGLPSKLKREGNVAVADIDINVEGMPKTMAAHSRIDKATKGFVGKSNENFKYQSVKNKSNDFIERNRDSEYKILDNIAAKINSNMSPKGKVTIFTERPACASCLDVAKQFENKYPGIKVNILDNKGNILNPKGEKK